MTHQEAVMTLIVAGTLALVGLGFLAMLVVLVRREVRKARLAGYPSFGAYLAASPRTDAEKRDTA